MANVLIHGVTVEDILSNPHNEFCGCQFITNNIHLDFQPVGVFNVPLVEANLSFFHDIKEVNGYVLLNIPTIDQVSFPNLRIIRGKELIPGANNIALAVAGRIQSFYLPLLTEISTGGVFFINNNDPTALCNVVDGSATSGYGVHWDDILNDDNSEKYFMITGCTGSGMSSLHTAAMICL